MNQAQAESLISLIPFRALLSIARALGGVGADPHRLPGGKSGLADALIRRYGADKILAQWQQEQQAPPPSGHATSATPGDAGNPDTLPPPEGSDTEGHAPREGDAQQDGTATPPQPAPAKGESAPGDEGMGEAAPEGAQGAQGEGEQGAPEGEGEQGEQGDAPTPPEAPAPGDAPPPPPEKESAMDAAMRAIAAEEAARAVYPHALWAEGTVAYLKAHAATPHAAPAPQGHAPTPDTSAPGAPPPLAVPHRRPAKGTVMHYLAPKLHALLAAGAQPLLIGPAGTGKSHAASAAADALGLTFASQSLSAGVSESALMGWLLPRADGPGFAYFPAPFVAQYEKGQSLFLLDEMDAASPDMLVIANAALANGGFTVPQRQEAPYVKRGPSALIMGACNTINGADEQYSARGMIDAATANRFYVLQWPHDPTLERHLAGLPVKQRYWSPKGLTQWTPEQWTRATECAIAWVDTVRQTINKNALQRVFSMRQVAQYQQALAAGCTHKEIRTDLLTAWAPDEIAKLPAAAQPKNAPLAGQESPEAPAPQSAPQDEAL